MDFLLAFFNQPFLAVVQFFHPVIIHIARNVERADQFHRAVRPFHRFSIVAPLVLVVFGQFTWA